jgi:hypothetical protein
MTGVDAAARLSASPTSEESFTPGPWVADEIAPDDPAWGAHEIWAQREDDEPELVSSHVCGPANARLIAAAPEMFEALLAVNKLIAEGALTGFNCKDGDWAERLFTSQQDTSRALAKAKGKAR